MPTLRPLVCGLDEAGRGPLAGAVYAAAVVLDPARPVPGLADSKALSPARRECLATEIRRHAWAWAVARAEVDEIASLNILQASLLAMRRALAGVLAGGDGAVATRLDAAPPGSIAPAVWLFRGGRCAGPATPALVLVDGLHCPPIPLPVRAVVRGDALVPAISAASILAKTARDAYMRALDARHPGYGFARHKGYPTAMHLAALDRLGPCAAHRLGFAPLRVRRGG